MTRPERSGTPEARVDREVNILMYHSISCGPKPLCITPQVFSRQLAVLQDCGRYGISLGEYVAWLSGDRALAEGFVVFTFDDGYEDFARNAFPELEARGWGATVFLPTAKIVDSGARHRSPGSGPTDCFMDWDTIRRLAANGIEFGGHGANHIDLTSVSPGDAEHEIATCKQVLDAKVPGSSVSFAAPYGRSNMTVQALVEKYFRCAAGTRLERATGHSPLFDLPRIEMWYFRDPSRWRRYLEGGSTVYFALRRWLRAARRLAIGGRQ